MQLTFLSHPVGDTLSSASRLLVQVISFIYSSRPITFVRGLITDWTLYVVVVIDDLCMLYHAFGMRHRRCGPPSGP